MALVVKDRVRETTTTTGTGTITLAGAVTGFDAFSEIGNSNTTYYAIVHRAADEWEVGVGTYTLSGTTLARTTVLASSNSGSATNFAAGTKDVICSYPAGKAVYSDASNVVNISSVSITGGPVSGITDITVADGGTGASSASSARTNLGVALGSDVQAYDAGLASIAGLTTAADKMIYTTDSDTYAVTDLTSAGRAILDDANASAQRTTLGLGTMATAATSSYLALAGGTMTGNLVLASAGVEFNDGTKLTTKPPSFTTGKAIAMAIVFG